MKPKYESLEAFRDLLRDVRSKIETLTILKEFTIEDYPIGGANRGNCKISVEYKRGHGYRPVKQTTDKHGRWCKPKAGTYRNGVTVVVTGEIVERDAAYLEVTDRGIWLQAANGDHTQLLEAPSSARREPLKYKMNDDPRELPADDPLSCDLWEEWKPAYLELCKWLHAKIGELNEQASSSASE